VRKLGGVATVKKRLTELANTLPRPGPDTCGVDGAGAYQFLIMDGKKYAALFIGPIEQVSELYEDVRCELDVMVMQDATSKAPSPLSGKTVVVTGFGSAARAELEDLLSRAGANVTHSVSGKTQVLVVGAKPGPEKLQKARNAGAEIIDEATARTRLAP
jgi:NAD-dependent DNA ligase